MIRISVPHAGAYLNIKVLNMLNHVTGCVVVDCCAEAPVRGREALLDAPRGGSGRLIRRAAAARSRARLSATKWVGSKRGGRGGALRGRWGDTPGSDRHSWWGFRV